MMSELSPCTPIIPHLVELSPATRFCVREVELLHAEP